MTDWPYVACTAAFVAGAVYRWAAIGSSAAVVSAKDSKPAERATPAKVSDPNLPVLAFQEDDDELDATKLDIRGGGPTAAPTAIVYDEEAALDEPTRQHALFLVKGAAESDTGLHRKRNEDRALLLEDDGIFAIADGMGGYRGGEIASELAVRTLEHAFKTRTFDGPAHDALPTRASELARAVQMANAAVFARASADKVLQGMGTTFSVARFSPNKQRLYVAHVGDSRVYRYRDGKLRQMTADHTMKALGVSGAGAGHLSRAVGIAPSVPVDIVLAKPRPGDVYLLCSDGLTKMVGEADIEETLRENRPDDAVTKLIAAANAQGGKDNVSVVVVRVHEPSAAAA